MKSVARTIREHWDGVVAYLKTRVTNGAAEALNGIIQNAKGPGTLALASRADALPRSHVPDTALAARRSSTSRRCSTRAPDANAGPAIGRNLDRIAENGCSGLRGGLKVRRLAAFRAMARVAAARYRVTDSPTPARFAATAPNTGELHPVSPSLHTFSSNPIQNYPQILLKSRHLEPKGGRRYPVAGGVTHRRCPQVTEGGRSKAARKNSPSPIGGLSGPGRPATMQTATAFPGRTSKLH